jgi:hypothetical protein
MLLFFIFKPKYKDITLEKYSKFKDYSIITPFYSFNNLSSNYKETFIFLYKEVFNNLNLFMYFFFIILKGLKLNLREVKKYLNFILNFKK